MLRLKEWHRRLLRWSVLTSLPACTILHSVLQIRIVRKPVWNNSISWYLFSSSFIKMFLEESKERGFEFITIHWMKPIFMFISHFKKGSDTCSVYCYILILSTEPCPDQVFSKYWFNICWVSEFRFISIEIWL